MKIEQLATECVYPSKTNPRTQFDEADQAELEASIKEKGVQDPIRVRPGKAGNSFEIIDGERRWKIAIKLKLEKIPCIVQEIKDEDVIELQLISHLQRKNIHPMEEAQSYQLYLGKLTKENQARRKAISELAQKIGKKDSDITQRLQLLELIPSAQKAYSTDAITIDHATLLAKMIPDDQKHAVEFLTENEDAIVALPLFRQWIEDEISLNLSVVVFDTKDNALVPGVPACIECPKNSSFNKALFPEINKHSICGDRHCLKAKVAAHLEREKKRIRKEEQRGFIMISSRQLAMDDPLKVDGVKMNGRYKIVKEGNECEDTKKAQWIDGPNKGKFTLVCNYSKCKKHFGGSGRTASSGSSDNYNSPANVAKRQAAVEKLKQDCEAETAFRMRLYDIVEKKYQPKKMLGFVLRLWLANDWQDKKLLTISDEALSKRLFLAMADRDCEVRDEYDLKQPHTSIDLFNIAAKLGIDVKKMRKEETSKKPKGKK